MRRNILFLPLILSVLFLIGLATGCEPAALPTEPDSERAEMADAPAMTLSAKPTCDDNPSHPSCGGDDDGSGGGGGGIVGDVVEGDGPAGSIASTCSTASGKGGWTLAFGHSGCLIVTPEGSAYSLTDDVTIVVTEEKGKNGRITHVSLRGQDVIGEEGIMHETDVLPVATPVVADKSGFTVHVHAQDVEVWRLSGHTDGDRVEVIGTIGIGDLVYTAQ